MLQWQLIGVYSGIQHTQLLEPQTTDHKIPQVPSPSHPNESWAHPGPKWSKIQLGSPDKEKLRKIEPPTEGSPCFFHWSLAFPCRRIIFGPMISWISMLLFSEVAASVLFQNQNISKYLQCITGLDSLFFSGFRRCLAGNQSMLLKQDAENRHPPLSYSSINFGPALPSVSASNHLLAPSVRHVRKQTEKTAPQSLKHRFSLPQDASGTFTCGFFTPADPSFDTLQGSEVRTNQSLLSPTLAPALPSHASAWQVFAPEFSHGRNLKRG